MNSRLLVLAAVLLVGCQKAPAPGTDTAARQDVEPPRVTPSANPATEDSLVLALFDYGLAFGETRAAIAGALGAPTHTASRTTENPYTPTTDSLFDLAYPGLRFWLMRLGADGRELLGNVELTAAERVLPGGVRCGSTSRETLTRLLGEPRRVDVLGDTLVMSYPRPIADAEEFVQLYVVRDTVRMVRWALYVD